MADNTELAVVLKLIADQFQSELKKSHGVLGDFSKALTDWKVQLTAVSGALFAIAKSTASYGEEAIKGAQKTGLGVEAFQRLSYAARIADLDQGQLIQGLKFLSQYMVETSQEGLSLQEMLLRTADRFARMTDGAAKNALAVKMFGRAGLELIPFLNQGRAGIEALMQEADRLGIVMSQKDAQAAAKFEDEFKKLTATTIGLKNALGVQLIPMLTDVLTLFKEGAALLNTPMGQSVFKLLSGQLGVVGIVGRSIAAYLRGPETDEPTAAATAPGMDEESHRKVREAAMKGQLGVIEETLKAELDKYKSAGDVLIAQAELDGSRRKKTEQEVTAEINSIRSGMFNAEITLLDQLRMTYEAYYIQRKALGFKTKEDEETFEQEHAKKLVGIRAKTEQKMDEWTAQGLQNAKAREEQKRAIYLKTQDALQEIDEKERARRRQSFIENADFIDLYKLGMQEYLTNLSNTFNVAVDMARQTADGMRQGFKTFFLDAMNGQMKTFRDLIRSTMNFVQGLIADVIAQLLTAFLLRKALQAGFFATAMDTGGVGVHSGGRVVRKFGLGGPVFSNGDSVPAVLTPGEYVVSRTGMDALNRLNRGDTSGILGGGQGNITVNLHNAPPGKTADVSVERRLHDTIINVVLRDLRQNGLLRQAFGAA